MGRQTAFPGILVTSIAASQGSSGRTLELKAGDPDSMLPENVTVERIKSFISKFNPLSRKMGGPMELTYNLEVAAYSEASAKAKSRFFVRAKNPFEIDFMRVDNVNKLRDLGAIKAGRNAYRVSVSVEK